MPDGYCVIGSFIVDLTGGPLRLPTKGETARFANAIGLLCMTKIDTAPVMLNRDKIDKLMRKEHAP